MNNAAVPTAPVPAARTSVAGATTTGARNGMPMLLFEKDALLRRTVVLTARTLGLANIHETGSQAVAMRMLREHDFRGAILALDFGERKYAQYDFALLDGIRQSEDEVCRMMPIAVLVDRCDAILLQALRQREVTRVILKPFRARTLLDTFAEFQAQRVGKASG